MTTALTPAQYKAVHQTSLSDDDLQSLIDEAEQAIIARYGAIEAVSEVRVGGTSLLQLARRASSITSVVERFYLVSSTGKELLEMVLAEAVVGSPVTLADDDYLLSDDGWWLQRLGSGTNPAVVWGQSVEVTYECFDDTDERRRVERQLVALELETHPGLAMQQIGAWTEQYAQGTDYHEKREEILASLGRGFAFA